MERERAMSHKPTCRAHCRNCVLCFASDAAFDAHLTHEPGAVFHEPPATMLRARGKRAGERMFASAPGTCAHRPECWDNGRLIARADAEIFALVPTPRQREQLAAWNARSASTV